jgi:hypothetical protein
VALSPAAARALEATLNVAAAAMTAPLLRMNSLRELPAPDALFIAMFSLTGR